uniref:Uncharacterized protein n=1 Tax=Panagrolaimus superbus TaxID=310955 RepID=A0A914YQ00_9BILA
MDGNQNGSSLEVIYDQIEEICDELDAEIISAEKLLNFVQKLLFYFLNSAVFKSSLGVATRVVRKKFRGRQKIVGKFQFSDFLGDLKL